MPFHTKALPPGAANRAASCPDEPFLLQRCVLEKIPEPCMADTNKSADMCRQRTSPCVEFDGELGQVRWRAPHITHSACRNPMYSTKEAKPLPSTCICFHFRHRLTFPFLLQDSWKDRQLGSLGPYHMDLAVPDPPPCTGSTSSAHGRRRFSLGIEIECGTKHPGFGQMLTLPNRRRYAP